MGKHDTYWNGLEQYQAGPEFQKGQKDEFQEELPIEEAFSEESLGLSTNRRDFLKIFGFGLTAAALTACVEKPIRKAVPYVIKPEDVTPGVSSWYATTSMVTNEATAVLVKSREGRPIKIEGNPEHPFTQGGVGSRDHASVLDLYDTTRLKAPRGSEGKMDWENVDKVLGSAFGNASRVAVVSNTVVSPSGRKAVKSFLSSFSQGDFIEYDPVSNYALAKAHTDSGDMMKIPTYKFGEADVIVGFEADFLGTWVAPTEYTKGWSKGRSLNQDRPKMSRHIQFESGVTVTGSASDLRIPLSPSKIMAALVTLHHEITGSGPTSGFEAPGNAIKRAAKELKKAQGHSLVVCGLNDVNAQLVTKAINEALGNYGSTVDVDNATLTYQGNDEAMMAFAKNADKYDAVVFLNDVNPVYDFMGGEELKTKLAKVKTSVAFVTHENETSKACNFALAQNHYLESWGDAQPKTHVVNIVQPLIRPLFDTRQWEHCLIKWSGNNASYYEYVADNWKNDVYPQSGAKGSFKKFWEESVQQGFVHVHGKKSMVDALIDAIEDGGEEEEELAPMPTSSPSQALSALVAASKAAKGTELVIAQSPCIGTGAQANNPWLQELPDPITKVTWDNYVTVPYTYAMDQGWKDGDMVDLSANGKSVKLPIVIQPGQANGTLVITTGYGRGEVAGKVAANIGVNAYPMVGSSNGSFSYVAMGASASAAGENIPMAKTQTYIGYELDGSSEDPGAKQQIEDRVSDYILKETTFAAYKNNPSSGNKRPTAHHMVSLWDIHDKSGHHWAMAIDLNKCTGCGSCIVSCNAENNIPVVGKKEVLGRREMHWMRIDRYFKGDPGAQDGSLQVAMQPMLCQHCDNAPCETVCPVLATVHSDEGLNQQVYNRCIGTRYCANNCPYKVRRFNWFSYYWNSDYETVNFAQHDKVGRLVLNPDVTVRARGVMEKCSFCVQRIQEKKLKAKAEMRKLKDGEIKVACQQSCPADAIVFGDLNDDKSEIHRLYMQNQRGYHALEDVKTLPSVLYMTKVRNVETQAAHSGKPSDHEEPHS